MTTAAPMTMKTRILNAMRRGLTRVEHDGLLGAADGQHAKHAKDLREQIANLEAAEDITTIPRITRLLMADGRINPTVIATIHFVQTGEHKGWVHTHGLCDWDIPELEVRDVPTFLMEAAAGILNTIALTMLNSEPGAVRVNEDVATSAVTVFRLVSLPLLDEQGHPGERWTVVEREAEAALLPQCPSCMAARDGYGGSCPIHRVPESAEQPKRGRTSDRPS